MNKFEAPKCCGKKMVFFASRIENKKEYPLFECQCGKIKQGEPKPDPYYNVFRGSKH